MTLRRSNQWKRRVPCPLAEDCDAEEVADAKGLQRPSIQQVLYKARREQLWMAGASTSSKNSWIRWLFGARGEESTIWKVSSARSNETIELHFSWSPREGFQYAQSTLKAGCYIAQVSIKKCRSGHIAQFARAKALVCPGHMHIVWKVLEFDVKWNTHMNGR